MRAVSLLMAPVALAACAASYRDVSNDPDVRALRGVICTTKVPLIEHGVVAYGATRRDGISSFSLTPHPGFSGPEVVGRRDIDPGHQLKVLSVRKCTNCLDFGAGRLDIEVQLDNSQSPFPIYLTGRFGGVDVLLHSTDGYVLNPSVCN